MKRGKHCVSTRNLHTVNWLGYEPCTCEGPRVPYGTTYSRYTPGVAESLRTALESAPKPVPPRTAEG